MTTRLSASSLAGTARTLVAVGTRERGLHVQRRRGRRRRARVACRSPVACWPGRCGRGARRRGRGALPGRVRGGRGRGGADGRGRRSAAAAAAATCRGRRCAAAGAWRRGGRRRRRSVRRRSRRWLERSGRSSACRRRRSRRRSRARRRRPRSGRPGSARTSRRRATRWLRSPLRGRGRVAVYGLVRRRHVIRPPHVVVGASQPPISRYQDIARRMRASQSRRGVSPDSHREAFSHAHRYADAQRFPGFKRGRCRTTFAQLVRPWRAAARCRRPGCRSPGSRPNAAVAAAGRRRSTAPAGRPAPSVRRPVRRRAGSQPVLRAVARPSVPPGSDESVISDTSCSTSGVAVGGVLQLLLRRGRTGELADRGRGLGAEGVAARR